MAKRNQYSFSKRQRELKKKKKQEEKRQRKLEKKELESEEAGGEFTDLPPDGEPREPEEE